MAAGEISRRGAGVVAAAVAHRVGLFVREAGEEREILLKILERLEDHRQLVILAEGRRRPILHVFALRNIDERQPFWKTLWCAAGGSGESAHRGQHDIQHRQGDDCPQAAKKFPAGYLPVLVHSYIIATNF